MPGGTAILPFPTWADWVSGPITAANEIDASTTNNLQALVASMGIQIDGYGTYGDDSHDDSAFIQNAVAAAAAQPGGGTVIIGAHTYLITRTITIPSNVTLVGLGRAVSILHYTGNDAAIRFQNAALSQPLATVGSKLYGFSVVGTAAGVWGIDLTAAQWCLVQEVAVSGFINSSLNAGVGFYLTGYHNANAALSVPCEHNQLIACDAYNNHIGLDAVGGSLSVTDANAQHNTMTGCSFHGSGLPSEGGQPTYCGVQLRENAYENVFVGCQMHHATAKLVEVRGGYNEFHGCSLAQSAGDGYDLTATSTGTLLVGGDIETATIALTPISNLGALNDISGVGNGTIGTRTFLLTNTLSIAAAFNLPATLNVTGASTLTSLTATGAVSLQGAGTGLAVVNNAIIGGTLSITGATNAAVLNVSGAATFSSTVNLTGAGTTLSVANSATIGNLTLTGTGNGLVATNNISVGGTIFGGVNSIGVAPNLTGALLSISATHVTDISSIPNAVVAGFAFSALAAPTLAAGSTGITTTNAYTLYIAGAPTASTNESIVNAYALGVNGTAIFTGTVTMTGALTIAGTLTLASVSTSGLISGAAGLTITGGAVNLNASSNFNTNINTGSSTGAVTIGSASAGALALASGAPSTFTVTGGNLTLHTAVSGAVVLNAVGAITLTSGNASTWTLPTITGALVFDTTTLTIDALNHRVGVGTLVPTGMFDVSGALSGAPTLNGQYLALAPSTFTDSVTAVGHTASASAAFNAMGTPTLAAANASVVTTNAYTFYIAGAPIAGTNQTISNSYALGVNGAVSFLSTLSVTGAATFAVLNATGIVTFSGSGNALNVTNNAIIGGTLTVNGTSTMAGAVLFSASGTAITVTNNMSIGGNLLITGTLGVSSQATFNTVNATGAVTIVGGGTALSVTNNVNIGGTLTVGGTVTFGTLSITNALTLPALGTALSVTHDAAIGGALTVSGLSTLGAVNAAGVLTLSSSGTALVVTNGASVGGTLAATILTASGAVTLSGAGTGLSVTNNATVGGTLGVTGTSTLAAVNASGVVTLSSAGAALVVTNNATIGGTLGVTGILTAVIINASGLLTLSGAGTALSVTNNATIGGTLGVTGTTTFSGVVNITVAGTGLAVTNNATVGGTLGVTGTLTAGVINASGLLTLSGAGTALSVTNNATIGGILTVTGTFTTTGLSIGGALNVASPNLTTAVWLFGSNATATDTGTGVGGTATNFAFHNIRQPTLAAQSTGVTTTNAYTFYIGGAPVAGANETLTNAYALGVNGAALIGGLLTINGLTQNSGQYTARLLSAASPASIGNGNTITPAGSTVRVTTAGAATGVILATGSAGQIVTVFNESGNTITFAIAATSNVAMGASAVIPANGCSTFMWDNQVGTPAWYKVG